MLAAMDMDSNDCMASHDHEIKHGLFIHSFVHSKNIIRSLVNQVLSSI